MEIKQLTKEQVAELMVCKILPNGKAKFFEKLEDMYKDNSEVLGNIKKCKELANSVDEKQYEKALSELLGKIGFDSIKDKAGKLMSKK